jgi:hypothetical protein
LGLGAEFYPTHTSKRKRFQLFNSWWYLILVYNFPLTYFLNMKYYYDPDHFSNNIELELLKASVDIKAKQLNMEIEEAFGKKIRHYWTRRDTLGYVFTDFEYASEGTYKRLIGKGEKDLFKNIREKYTCVVLSTTQDKNFREFDLGTEKGIIINVDNFKEFLTVLRNSKNTVTLFLYKFENKRQEDLIKAWLRNYPIFEKVTQEAQAEDIDTIRNVIKKLKIETPAELEKLIEITRATSQNIKSNLKYFEDKLKEFKTKLDEDVSEPQIRDFLYDNIWLLDFQYSSYDRAKEETVQSGRIDIILVKDNFGLSRAVIVELKKPSAQVTTEKWRTKENPAIVAEVGHAISQAINYIQSKKSQYTIPKGIVIIGRKAGLSEKFLEAFSYYLHGIEVLTYDHIYENAEKVIDHFKPKPETQCRDIVPLSTTKNSQSEKP